MSSPVLLRLVANSVKIASRAAELIRDILKKGELGIVTKGKNDFQTEADRAAQRCIMASLFKNFPKVSIYGEEEEDPNNPIQPDWLELRMDEEVLKKESELPENLKNAKDEELVVWVDPVDGTAEYTQGFLDHVTVLIGIAHHGKAVAGVIYQPFYNYEAGPDAKLGRCIWGIVGMGAFGYEPCELPAGEHIITTTRSHTTQVVTEAIQACEPTDVLKVGGAGHKVLLILEGKAHAYVFASPGCKKWDTCAPEAVLHAVGGKLTDIHGHTYTYKGDVQRRNCGGVLAVLDAKKHQWYVKQIPKECKDTLPV